MQLQLKLNKTNVPKRRWLVLLGGLLLMCTAGYGYCWSLMVDPMIELRGATDGYMATIYSVMTIAVALFTMIGGKLVDKFGTSKILFSAVVLFAIGQVLCGVSESLGVFAVANIVLIPWQQAIVYLAIFANLVKLFPDMKGFATALSGLGLSIGGAVLPPIIQHYIASIGFSTQFLIIGVWTTVCGLIGLFLFPDAGEGYIPEGKKIDEEDEVVTSGLNPNFVQKDWKAMLKDPIFYFAWSLPIWGSTAYMLLSYQMSWIAQDMLGISAMKAAFLVSLVSIVGIASAILGPISDRTGRLGLNVVLYGAATVSCAGFIIASNMGLGWFVLCTVVYLGAAGGTAYIQPALVSDLYGSKYYGFNFSIFYIAVCLAGTISPWLGVLGRTGEGGNYTLTFTITTIMCAIGFISSLIVWRAKKNDIEYLPKGIFKKNK